MMILMLYTHKCENCGTQIERNYRSRYPHIFCSVECSRAAAVAATFSNCERCGSRFKRRSNPNQRFCQRSCYQTAMSEAANDLAGITERFWASVDKNGPVCAHRPELGPCWMWTGVIHNGYGQFHAGPILGLVRVHRFSYEREVGPIPEGLEVRHECDTPPCVRPDHLGPGSHADNMRDVAKRGRWQINGRRRLKEHARRGDDHPYSIVTSDQVAAMRRRYEAGETIKGLAKEYGMKYQGAYQIIRRVNWKHIP